ncbi:MAG: hypothetical protein ACI4KF_04380 [Huintestinicola sp.]
MEIILWISVVFIICTISYYVVCRIIMMWCGCNLHTAMIKVHNFLNGEHEYAFNEDAGFADDVRTNIRNIIGDKRYNQLIDLSQTAILTPLMYFGDHCGLHYIAISVYYDNDNEKQIIQAVISNLTKQYLQVHGYTDDILIDWLFRDDLKMPVLRIKYAMTDDEKRIMAIMKQSKVHDVITINTNVIDTEDSEDLN